MKTITASGEVRDDVLTVADLKRFIAWAESAGKNIDDLPLHVLDMAERDSGENGAAYATHIELDCFETESGDSESPPVKVVSILAWPDRKRTTYPERK